MWTFSLTVILLKIVIIIRIVMVTKQLSSPSSVSREEKLKHLFITDVTANYHDIMVEQT